MGEACAVPLGDRLANFHTITGTTAVRSPPNPDALRLRGHGRQRL